MEKRDKSVVQILSLSLEFLEGGSFFGRLSRYSKGVHLFTYCEEP